MQEITGTNGMSRMNNEKGGALQAAQMMQQAREAADATVNPRPNTMMLANQMQQQQRP
jgi:hypothetical protein